MSEANHRPAPDALDRATDAMRDTRVPPGPPAELVAATIAAINNRLTGAVPNELARQQHRRRIMRYVGFGTATVAAVAVAATAAVLLFGGGSASARVQKALDNAGKAKSVRIVYKTGRGADEKVVTTIHRDSNRIRVEQADGVLVIADLDMKKRLALDPAAKTARLHTLTADEVQATADVYAAFANPAKAVRDDRGTVREVKAEKLGGRDTTVYDLTTPADEEKATPGVHARLWVDTKTELPARIEVLEGQADGGPTVIEFHQWNESFDAKLFKLDVPAGYERVEDSSQPDDRRTLFARFILPAVQNAEKAKSVKVVATIENDGKATYVRTIYRQGDLVRMETVNDAELAEDPPVIVADLKTRKALILHPKAKTAHRTTFGEQEVKLVTGVMDGLSGIKEQVAGGDEKAVKDLGEEKLGDRKTRVYAVTGQTPPGVWKVWVDPKTELPVRVRLASEKGKHTFTLDFEKWNEEFDPKLFKRDVPDGYKLIDGEKKD